MNAQTFDRLARAVSPGCTRRRIVTALGPAALAAAVGVVGVREAAAECRKNRKACDRDRDCCSGRCRGGRCRCIRNGQPFPNGDASLCCGGRFFGDACSSPCLTEADCPGDEVCFFADPFFDPPIPGFCAAPI